jgi:hypothetical protein
MTLRECFGLRAQGTKGKRFVDVCQCSGAFLGGTEPSTQFFLFGRGFALAEIGIGIHLCHQLRLISVTCLITSILTIYSSIDALLPQPW